MWRENSDLEPDGQPQPWPMPVKDRVWVDSAGNQWHMRGPELTAKTMRRLLRRPDLRVLHAYGLQPREVIGAERDALLTRLSQSFSGDAPPMSDFRLGDFRTSDSQVMLVVEESC